MDKQHKILAFVIIFIIIAGFAYRPHMLKRKAILRATETVARALEYWANGDSATGRNLWSNPAKFPKIYDLTSYQILDNSLRRDGRYYYTKVYVKVDFAANSLFPTGRVWVFECKQVNTICTIQDFYLTDRNN